MKSSFDDSSSTSVIPAFLDAIQAAGLDYSGPIIADGVLHRIKVNGDRSLNSFYTLHLDGIAAGHIGCFKRGISQNWCAVSNGQLTESERAERDRIFLAAQAERDAERRRQNNEAATAAQAILDAAQDADDLHPYLVRKAVKVYPGVKMGVWPQRQADQCLLIPLRTADGLLATVQAILPEKLASGRDKDFLKGGAKSGAHFVIGDLHSSETVIIAEGYATAATLFEATGYPAVMAVDAGNLRPVAEILKKLHPKKRFIIAADNDRTTEGNPGVKAATAAAKAVKGIVAIPSFNSPLEDDVAGTDFNDLAALFGLERVKEQVESAIQFAKGTGQAKPGWDNASPWRNELMRRADSDQLLKNHYNAVMVVENAYPGLVGYNEFRQRIEARIESPWRKSPGQWTEADTGELAFHLAKEFTSFTLDSLAAAVMTVAYRHPFNPAQDRLRALAEQWDGTPRLDTWLIDYLGAASNSSNDVYLREISSAYLKGVVARVLFPGCKRDDVLVLRGDQGIGKSTAAQCIAESIHPDTFTDSLGNLDSKDSKAAIRGIIIAELGELSVLNKSDLESIKVYVATRTDHFREAYGRGERDYPRTVSFIGTTNHPTFLKDPTGNRRFWPVTIPAPIDIPRLTDDLPQLIGEAARRVLDGEKWFVNDRTALAQADAVRAAHFVDDVWTEAALKAAGDLLSPGCTLEGANPDYVTVASILSAMGVRIEQQTIPNQTRIGSILRVNGFKDKKTRIGARKDNKTVWAWYPPVVPPIEWFPLVVPLEGCRQIPAVPPVPPVTPYFNCFTKNEGSEKNNSGNRECSNSDSQLSAPAIYPFYENRDQPGEPGEPLGKQGIGQGEPKGEPLNRGNHSIGGTESPTPPLTPPQFTVMAAIKAAGLYGETRDRIAKAAPKLGGAMVKVVLAELIAAGRVAERDGRYVAQDVTV